MTNLGELYPTDTGIRPEQKRLSFVSANLREKPCADI